MNKNENKWVWFLVLVLILLNVTTLYSIFRIQDNIISGYQDTSTGLRHEMRSLSRAVDQTVDKVEKEKLWIRDTDIELIRVDDTGSALIRSEFAINEVKDGETLQLVVYGYDKSSKLETVKRVDVDASKMRHMIDLSLNLYGNYTFELEGTHAGIIRSSSIGELSLMDRMNDRIDGHVDFEQNPNYARLTVSVHNDLQLLEETMMREVTLYDDDFVVVNGSGTKTGHGKLMFTDLDVKVYLNDTLLADLNSEGSWTKTYVDEDYKSYHFKASLDMDLLKETDEIRAVLHGTDGYGIQYNMPLHIDLDVDRMD